MLANSRTQLLIESGTFVSATRVEISRYDLGEGMAAGAASDVIQVRLGGVPRRAVTLAIEITRRRVLGENGTSPMSNPREVTPWVEKPKASMSLDLTRDVDMTRDSVSMDGKLLSHVKDTASPDDFSTSTYLATVGSASLKDKTTNAFPTSTHSALERLIATNSLLDADESKDAPHLNKESTPRHIVSARFLTGTERRQSGAVALHYLNKLTGRWVEVCPQTKAVVTGVGQESQFELIAVHISGRRNLSKCGKSSCP